MDFDFIDEDIWEEESTGRNSRGEFSDDVCVGVQVSNFIPFSSTNFHPFI